MENFLIGALLVFHFLVGIFLVVIVLMQRTKEGGMGAAFGAGVTDSLFGASSGNVLTKITVWTAAIFFTTSLAMAVIFSHRGGTTIGAGALGQSPKAPATPAITDPSGTMTNGATATPQGTLTPPPIDTPKAPNGGETPKEPAPAPAPQPENATPPSPPPPHDAPTSPEPPKVNP
jgi:preprotein translocase subunit SecG